MLGYYVENPHGLQFDLFSHNMRVWKIRILKSLMQHDIFSTLDRISFILAAHWLLPSFIKPISEITREMVLIFTLSTKGRVTRGGNSREDVSMRSINRREY